MNINFTSFALTSAMMFSCNVQSMDDYDKISRQVSNQEGFEDARKLAQKLVQIRIEDGRPGQAINETVLFAKTQKKYFNIMKQWGQSSSREQDDRAWFIAFVRTCMHECSPQDIERIRKQKGCANQQLIQSLCDNNKKEIVAKDKGIIVNVVSKICFAAMIFTGYSALRSAYHHNTQHAAGCGAMTFILGFCGWATHRASTSYTHERIYYKCQNEQALAYYYDEVKKNKNNTVGNFISTSHQNCYGTILSKMQKTISPKK